MTVGSRPGENAGQPPPKSTIAAIFATEHAAREAARELRRAGYAQTWVGVTRKTDATAGEPLVEDANPLVRFFSADRLPLNKALQLHGVSEQQAGSIEAEIVPGCSIVTVYANSRGRASELLEAANGKVVYDDGTAQEAASPSGAKPGIGASDGGDEQEEGAADGARGWSYARDEHVLGMASSDAADDALYEEFFEVRRV